MLSISRENCANARERTRVRGVRADLLADSSLRPGLFREREREKNRSVRSDKKRKRERNERKKKNIPARPEAFSERGTYRAAKRYSDFAVASAIPRSVTKVQAIGIIANANERNNVMTFYDRSDGVRLSDFVISVNEIIVISITISERLIRAVVGKYPGIVLNSVSRLSCFILDVYTGRLILMYFSSTKEKLLFFICSHKAYNFCLKYFLYDRK